MDEKEMQEKVILYQIMQKHLESLGQNASMLEKRYEEIEMTRQVLEDIGKLNEKNDILIPLGSGFFGHGKITEQSSMLTDVGAGIFMPKDAESSKAILDEKKKEIEKLANDLQQEMSEVSARIGGLAMELEQASHEPEHKHEHKGPEGDKSRPHSRDGKGHPHREEKGGG